MNKLQEFIDVVQAQIGRHITADVGPILMRCPGRDWHAAMSPCSALMKTKEWTYRGGIAANVFSMFSSMASVERTPASM